MSFLVTPEPYILITDKNLNYIGDPISQVNSIDVTKNWNQPDSGTFVCPALPEYMSSLTRGHRAMVIRDGGIFSAGPIERPGGYEWGVGGDNASTEAEPGLITVDFTDDSVHLASRLVFPNPALAGNDSTQPAYYQVTDNSVTIMRNLVNLNAGPGARAPRIVPKLALGTFDAGTGETYTLKSRFERMSDVLRTVADNTGQLGFEVVQEGDQLLFNVFVSEDKTAKARFSRGLGNLRSVKYDLTAPTGTVAFVGGSGEEADRTVIVRNNATDETNWWRTELWVEGSQQDDGTGTDTAGTMAAAGDDALGQNAEKVQLITVTVDTEDVKFGREFGLGDYVTIEVMPGIEVYDTVRSVHYTYTPDDGEDVSILVGTQEATNDPLWLQVIDSMATRLSRLERK